MSAANSLAHACSHASNQPLPLPGAFHLFPTGTALPAVCHLSSCSLALGQGRAQLARAEASFRARLSSTLLDHPHTLHDIRAAPPLALGPPKPSVLQDVWPPAPLPSSSSRPAVKLEPSPALAPPAPPAAAAAGSSSSSSRPSGRGRGARSQSRDGTGSPAAGHCAQRGPGQSSTLSSQCCSACTAPVALGRGSDAGDDFLGAQLERQQAELAAALHLHQRLQTVATAPHQQPPPQQLHQQYRQLHDRPHHQQQHFEQQHQPFHQPEQSPPPVQPAQMPLHSEPTWPFGAASSSPLSPWPPPTPTQAPTGGVGGPQVGTTRSSAERPWAQARAGEDRGAKRARWQGGGGQGEGSMFVDPFRDVVLEDEPLSGPDAMAVIGLLGGGAPCQ